MMTTKTQRDEWQRLSDAASAGPVRFTDNDGSTSRFRQQNPAEHVVTSYGTQFAFGVDIAAFADRHEAKLYIAAREAVPALLQDVERLTKLLGRFDLDDMCICHVSDGENCLACDCLTTLRRMSK